MFIWLGFYVNAHKIYVWLFPQTLHSKVRNHLTHKNNLQSFQLLYFWNIKYNFWKKIYSGRPSFGSRLRCISKSLYRNVLYLFSACLCAQLICFLSCGCCNCQDSPAITTASCNYSRELLRDQRGSGDHIHIDSKTQSPTVSASTERSVVQKDTAPWDTHVQWLGRWNSKGLNM